MRNSIVLSCLLLLAVTRRTHAANVPLSKLELKQQVDALYPRLFEFYIELHAHPELSWQEKETSGRMATELKQAGYEVSAGIGGYGVAAVLKNGAGPCILIRTDMDGLPVKEQTGLPYASSVTVKNELGVEVPVMHACGHDIHMSSMVGIARILAGAKDKWKGMLVVVCQQAEERGSGARAMIKDGLFKKFPRPDFCLALHDDAELATGTLGYAPGFAMANVDSVDITVRGVGGHGAYPHKTRDPIVLASQIVVALQTIVSREIMPGEAAVVTVGSIHGGTKHNIIPDEVKLQLTVRSYTEEVRKQTLDAIKRIVRGEAITAGMPEDRMPEVSVSGDYTPATYNDPQLTERVVGVFREWFGETNVIRKKPSMGGEDFSEFGRTEDRIPIFMFVVGGVKPEALAASEKSGKPLPSLHSPLWAPDPEPTIKTGVTAMVAAVMDLMRPK
jgi:hippurate hydrolase